MAIAGENVVLITSELRTFLNLELFKLKKEYV